MSSNLTTSQGHPVDDNQNSVTAGEYGPIVISDFHLIDKLSQFDRERIPERVVHAKGAGAHGYFKVTHDISKFTKAKLFDTIGKVTPVFTRFSTVAGENRDLLILLEILEVVLYLFLGFAIKFYTE